jgi:ABC-type lipopolysaccharide export system ATPase subunit
MEKLPTAEEILEKYNKQFEENGIVYNLSKPMIEFAKLHVEAQLKAILEKTNYTQRTVERDEELEEMITDAYPLTHIK